VSDSDSGTAILPVDESQAAQSNHQAAGFSSAPSSTIHIKLRKAHLRIEGNADPALLRAVLECLRR